jgi:phage tail sheath protein FI
MGPIDAPTRLTSLDDFVNTYGDRITGVESYDALDAYFHEGGATAYFLRLADGAVAATASATSIVAGNTLDAASPGAWGDGLKLDVVSTPGGMTLSADEESSSKSSKSSKKADAPQRSALLTFPDTQATPTFMATVSLGGKAVQTSQPMVTRRELSQFLGSGSYMVIIGPDDDTPIAAGSVTLAGGDDGTVPVASTTALPDALAVLNPELGPGQVLAPGKSSTNDHGALLAHAAACNRFAILDGAVGDDALALASAAALLRGAAEDRYGMLWGPWAVVPGLAPGTSRTVPWSPVQAALCARNDLAGNPNQAAAGSWGQTQWVSDLAQRFTPEECETLLYAGVDTARSVYGTIEAYAFRSLSDPAGNNQQWVQANFGRLSMAIVADGEATGEDFVFSQLDGRGLDIAAFGGALAGDLIRFYNAGALYGEDPTEAFVVNVGPAVNTLPKLADGILSAVVSVRMSPHAELVQIQIVKQPITVSLV